MKTRRSFDYCDFYDNYGMVFDADRYTPKQAIEIYKQEKDIDKDALDVDFEVYEIKVRWYPRMNKDDMWHYDIFDNEDNRGIYKVVEDEDIHLDPKNKGFRCLRVRYDKAHEEVRSEYSRPTT